MSDTPNKHKITPEMQSELPLAVRQLLDITEETVTNETDWSPDTTKTNANKMIEETNIVTKTPVAVQQNVYPEAEVKESGLDNMIPCVISRLLYIVEYVHIYKNNLVHFQLHLLLK